MEIRVSGHQMETGDALRVHAEDRLGTIVGKYFSKALSSVVTFGKAPAGHFRCDIVTHVMHGLILKGAGIATDAHVALRRYKRRLKDRHEASAHAQREEQAAYVVFAEPEPEAEEVTVDAPLVIAEMRVDVPEATVSDAVMMLDLRNTNALLFKNAGTGTYNMVYRRGDGSIGWVEPS